MNKVNEDFLWAFKRMPIPAMLLSRDGKVIAITQVAKGIFVGKGNNFKKTASSLFNYFGLDLTIKDGAKKPIVKISDQKLFSSFLCGKKILNMDWKIRESSFEDKTKNLILYSDTIDSKCKECDSLLGNRKKTEVGCAIGSSAINLAEYLENIILCMPGNVFWIDKNGVHLGCNEGRAYILGLKSREEIIGKTYEDLAKMKPDIIENINSWKKSSFEVIKTGKPKLNIEEIPIMGPDGSELTYLTNKVPLLDECGSVIGVLGVSMDISDRKRAQKIQAEKDKEIVRKTSEFMKVLAGSIAHEIRTPLAIIGLNMDLIKMDPCFIVSKDSKGSNFEKYFSNIKYAVKSTAYIVDNILTTLRTISSGGMTENRFVKLSMLDDIKTLLNVYPFLVHEKSLININQDEMEDFSYLGDRLLTQHVLFNILKNALQAIKEAEKGKIEISFAQRDKYNILTFRDTSLGISKENMHKVFDQFKTGKNGGAGLGMAFCKMVMQSYGGDITCDSEVNEYTEFRLSFPKILS